jgi:uncharacterized protein
MLLSFRVSNFLSIRDEQEFSFINAPEPTRAGGGEGWDEGVGTLAGIFGPNASGKSNILKAINFMRSAVGSSYASWAEKDSIPVTSFALDASCENESSLFEVVFVSHGVRYQYGFRVTSRRVVGEWLYAYVTHRRQVWFERDVSSDEEWYFGKSFNGRNRVISELARPTALFLSTAVANNHKMAMQVEHFFRYHLRTALPDDRISRTRYTQEMSSNEGQWRDVVALIRFADLGIRDARVRREALGSKERQTLMGVFKALGTEFPEGELNSVIDSTEDRVEFAHSTGNGREPVYLSLRAESLGTQTWFALVGPILRAINDGDTLTVDEIDSSLHPHLTSEIIKIFKDPARNPKQAQLLFTSHDTTLLGGWLDEKELTRDQVWFTEKKSNGATALYPLTDFSPRKTENLERGYLQGRYGAIPYLDSNLIPRVAVQTGGELGNFEPDPEHDDGESATSEGTLS